VGSFAQTSSSNIVYVNGNATGLNNGTSWKDAYTKLQDGLAAAVSGNQIWVAKGTYYPDEGGTAIDNDRLSRYLLKNGVALYGGFAGTETVLSQRNITANRTILSGDIDQDETLTGNAFNVVHSELVGNTAILDGFSITGAAPGGGNNIFGQLSGMSNIHSSPSVLNCYFYGNSSRDGGGMHNSNSSPTVINCVFAGNFAFSGGGGMGNFGGSVPRLFNCLFIDNRSGGGSFPDGSVRGGGAIENLNSFASINNCTFFRNSSPIGGIVNIGSTQYLTNCILWNNGDEQITNEINGVTSVSYSIVQGNTVYPGTGNSSQDPLFADAINGDMHLQACSPAVNAGDNTANSTTTDLDRNPRIGGGRIDMGAYEYNGSFYTYYADGDGDGYGNPYNAIITSCPGPPQGYVDNNYDADDADGKPLIYVCHNGASLVVNANALQAHLNHRDAAGRCMNLVTVPLSSQATKAIEGPLTAPKRFALFSYPNPASKATHIQYSIPADATVSIKVFDLMGREVGGVFSGERAAGTYSEDYGTSKLTSGIYYIRLVAITQVNRYTQTLKLVKIE
jgi:hypothetical protein